MYSQQEMLQFAIESGMLDESTIQEKMIMNERKKYLEKHPYKIWEGKDGKWYTYLPNGDERKLLKRANEKSLHDELIKYYKITEEEPTVRKVFYEWIERKLKYGEIQKQTYDRYVIDFEKFIGTNKISNRKIKTIDENELEDFIMDTILENKLTSKSWSNLRLIIKAIFIYSKKRKYSKLNISMFFSELEISNKVFTKSKRQDDLNVFTEEELKKIIEKLWEKNKIGHLGVLMAVYTGMRVGEIASLKWEDVKENYIHINRCQIKYKDENGKTVHEIRNSPKTEAGIRDVVIIPEVRKVLKKARTINPFSEYVFEKNGEPMSIHAFGMILYRICEEVGVTKRGMHVLRKTYATRLINAGVEESIIINQMGHTDIKTTKNYYYYNNKANGYMSEMIQNALAL